MNKFKLLICGSISYVGHSLIEALKEKYIIDTFDGIISIGENLNKYEKKINRYDVILYLIHDHSNDISKNEYILKLFLDKIGSKQKFIFFSSFQVTENNDNNYTKVKKNSEKIIVKNNKNYIILRPALIINKKINLINIKEQFLLTLLTFLKKYKIAVLLANGKFYLNLVSIKDVCTIIECCIHKNLKNKIIDINNNESIRFIDIIKIIKKEYKIFYFYLPIPLIMLQILSKIFPKKISEENIKALKFKKTFVKSNLISNYTYKIKNNNLSIIKKLFGSL